MLPLWPLFVVKYAQYEVKLCTSIQRAVDTLVSERDCVPIEAISCKRMRIPSVI